MKMKLNFILALTGAVGHMAGAAPNVLFIAVDDLNTEVSK